MPSATGALALFAPRCFTVDAGAGISVTRTALNGAGFEGQCTHATPNTGAMPVTGGG